MKKSVLLFITVILAAHSARSQESDYSFKEVYKITEPANLVIESDNSNIEVIAHEGNNVEVFYIVQKGNNLLKMTKDEIEDEVSNQWKFRIESTKNSLDIAVLSTVITGHINSEDAIDVHFKVYVPKQTSTRLHSSDGDILLKGLTSNQNCMSSDGDIKLVDLSGEIFAKTSDGDIIVDNVTGLLDSHTSDGRVINLSQQKL
ncbi:DUF4097 family beta strand repeat-containing protein [Winogradskyella jejuensis]|uniref:Adhesin domain-containing protein n=1 Tax=Winogradskyella jejuensis TaxID=1089305 RepID=A0A1M5VX68_9FLAO|nr:hypothetical protein [Winogradskyella jejuensis]SHH79899.1 hypothetical protein SAMN05444148_2847 [Winogradskyella jejuensis]